MKTFLSSIFLSVRIFFINFNVYMQSMVNSIRGGNEGSSSPKSVRSVASAQSGVVANEYVNDEDVASPQQQQNKDGGGGEDKQQKQVNPSYKTKQNIKSVLLLSAKQSTQDVNDQYCRTRRYDTAGKYRIGPTFITKVTLFLINSFLSAERYIGH